MFRKPILALATVAVLIFGFGINVDQAHARRWGGYYGYGPRAAYYRPYGFYGPRAYRRAYYRPYYGYGAFYRPYGYWW